MPPSPIPIAFCITELDPGGAERQLLSLVTHLDRAEWSPHVYALGPEAEIAAKLRDANIPVECFGARRSWQFPSVVRRLTARLKDTRARLLQTFLFHANLAGRFAARRAGIPVVCGIRVAEREKRWHLRLDRLTQNTVCKYVCVSRGVADFCEKIAGIDPRRLEIIPNGIDLSPYKSIRPADLSPFGIPPDAEVIVTVARLHPQKGLLDLCTACEPLFDSRPRLHLLIVGEGPQRSEIEHWIARRQLQSRIHLPGWRADAPSIVKAAHLFVLSSHWEGMSNALLEAAALEIPVVATDVEGVHDLIENGRSGHIVPPASPEQLRSAILDLLDNRPTARAFAQALQVHVQKHFTATKTAAAYARLYRRILTSP